MSIATPSSVPERPADPSPVLCEGAEVEFGGIRWKVLKCDSEALMISKGTICRTEYNPFYSDDPYDVFNKSARMEGWAACRLHNELESIFLQRFSDEEKDAVIKNYYTLHTLDDDRQPKDYQQWSSIDCPTKEIVGKLKDGPSQEPYWVKISVDDGLSAGICANGKIMELYGKPVSVTHGARGLIRVDISTSEHKRLLKVISATSPSEPKPTSHQTVFCTPLLRVGAEVEFGGIRWKVLECGSEALMISKGIICTCEYSFNNYSSDDQGGWVNTWLHNQLHSIYGFFTTGAGNCHSIRIF